VRNLILIIILFTLSQCQQLTSPFKKESFHGGVVLTFDDNYVDSWSRADSVFQKYNWKATFCITEFHKLNEKQKKDLLFLQSEGNEIAFHGTHHERAAYYLNSHSPSEYLNYEIFPDLNAMKKYGFNIKCFAYPGGVRSKQTDSLLWNYFKVLRSTTFLALPPEEQRCFATKKDTTGGKRLVFAIGIDSHYKHMRISYIDTLLNYAYKNSFVVLFYGHHIEKNVTQKYITAYSTLKHICDFVEKKRMKFYTLSNLAN